MSHHITTTINDQTAAQLERWCRNMGCPLNEMIDYLVLHANNSGFTDKLMKMKPKSKHYEKATGYERQGAAPHEGYTVKVDGNALGIFKFYEEAVEYSRMVRGMVIQVKHAREQGLTLITKI